jgi:regulator of protease activity HflC (stomatin/prohibitin superfamily)
MKYIRYFALALIALALPILAGCSYKTVPAGNVGVKFNNYGSDKGVQATTVGPGRYWLGMNEYIYEYPTFTQTYNWTKSANEGRAADESLSFQTVEGLSVNADVGITYAIEPDKVVLIFQKYRKGVDEITDVYLRNMVRDSLVKEASTLRIESVYGSGKAALIEAVNADVKSQVEPLGIKVDKIFFLGDLRLPDNVTKSINAKIQATQMAEQRQNEVVQSQAEGAKEVALAQARATAKVAEATADAQAIALRGKALRDFPDNARAAIDKWDGHVPQYNGGGAVPFVNIK